MRETLFNKQKRIWTYGLRQVVEPTARHIFPPPSVGVRDAHTMGVYNRFVNDWVQHQFRLASEALKKARTEAEVLAVFQRFQEVLKPHDLTRYATTAPAVRAGRKIVAHAKHMLYNPHTRLGQRRLQRKAAEFVRDVNAYRNRR